MKSTSIKALSISLITLIFGCSSEKEAAKTLPQLTTTTATSVTLTNASTGGNVSSDGGAPVTSRGVVWNNATVPTISLSTKTSDGTGTGSFTSAIANLTPSTNYYARAYATNSVGTAYGNEIAFTTGAVVLPTLTTTAATSITTNSAVFGGTISADGGAAITAKGVCWSTSANPTITLTTKTTDGIGIGTYTSSLTGLTASITYYVRAYATNSAGTAYGNEISFTTLQNSTAIYVPGPNVTDIDGNTYQSVTISGLTFTKQNLNVSKYTDGTPIPQVQDQTQWANLVTGAWCYYNNDPANNATYGKLYNWYAVAGIYDNASLQDRSLRKKLAPTGWHIPSDAEWTILTNFLGGTSIAGGKMKSTGTIQAGTGLWQSPNTAATNESGFTGLPAGYRFYYSNGTFNYIGSNGYWWSSSEYGSSSSWYRRLNYNNGFADSNDFSNRYGFSVRCLRD